MSFSASRGSRLLAGLLCLIAAVYQRALPAPAQSPLPTSEGSPASQSAHAQKLKIAGIPNAGKVTDFLYRGAQPKAPGFAELKKLGITTVVDLRGASGETEREGQEVEALGMRFVPIPSSGWSPPSDEHVAQFLSLIRANPGAKIFVHCRLGEDRTGVFIAAYRIAAQHWTADEAINELYSFGFHGFWHPGMRSYVREFPARFASAPAFAPLRAPLSER